LPLFLNLLQGPDIQHQFDAETAPVGLRYTAETNQVSRDDSSGAMQRMLCYQGRVEPENDKAADRKFRGFLTQYFLGWFSKTDKFAAWTHVSLHRFLQATSCPGRLMEHSNCCRCKRSTWRTSSNLQREARGSGTVGFAFRRFPLGCATSLFI
jgi:hypothetical protein